MGARRRGVRDVGLGTKVAFTGYFGAQGGLAELEPPRQGLGLGRGLVARLKWSRIRAGLPSKVQGKAGL